MSLPTDYNNSINKQLNLAAVFPLNTAGVAPGAYGFFYDGTWQRVGTIEDFGEYQTPSSPAPYRDSFNYSTQHIKSVNYVINGSYQVVPEIPVDAAQAAIKFTFSASNQFQATLNGLTNVAYDLSIFSKIAGQVRTKDKFYDWRFITSVIYAESVVLFGAESSKASITLNGSGTALTEYGEFSLSESLSFGDDEEMSFKHIGVLSPEPYPFAMNLISYSKHHSDKIYYQRNGNE
ncbi:hypothetical protein [Nitrosomonas nitrosa]|uniref:hypothetical protein n=1 Tax=Nitrosomonas nitrosa TaxID=52442 RepID=UPI0023F6FCC3|nr:hypothetical protein [Nitrosomonas nitrosa]MCO6435191.1 hypothetical protein [Nitrosomonas nitrosa]